MTPLAWLLVAGARASLGQVHAQHHHEIPHAGRTLDMAPLHAMRGGLVALRNKLAGELAGMHNIHFPEVPEEQIDSHFHDLTGRLLKMEDQLADPQLHDLADKAKAFQLRDLAAQTKSVLSGVNGHTPVDALKKAQLALVKLKGMLDAMQPHGRTAGHSLMEQQATAQHLDQHLERLHAKERKYDEALDSMDQFGEAVKVQMQELKSSQAAQTKKQAADLKAVLFASGAMTPDVAPAGDPRLLGKPVPRLTDIGLGQGRLAPLPEHKELAPLYGGSLDGAEEHAPTSWAEVFGLDKIPAEMAQLRGNA